MHPITALLPFSSPTCFRRLAVFFSTLLLVADTGLALGWGTVVYEHSVLVRQREECPPTGPHPFHGCDQCLPYAYMPANILLRVFCGDASRDWCPLRWEECDECNGSCAIIYREGDRRWVNVLWNLDRVHQAIETCRQWNWQTYGQGSHGPVSGAYAFGDEFEWIPPHARDYIELIRDPLYHARLAAYSGEPARDLESAWRYRIGLFATLATRAPTSDDRAFYERAANLCAWYHVARFAPSGEAESTLVAAGFPLAIGSREWTDLETIQGVTCSEPLFADCWDEVEPTTWGAIKNLYR